MNLNFKNKIVLVVGGSSGIGLEIVKQFYDSGATVFICSRNPPTDLSYGFYIACDVKEEGSVKSMVQEVVDRESKIDILVNSMGITGTDKVENISLSKWKNIIDTNLTGVFLTCREVIPVMKKNKSGKIVNIASLAGRFRSATSGAHYVASKAAVIGFTRQLASEVISYGINVNAVCPSQTLTPMLQRAVSKEKIEQLESNIPIGRLATVGEQSNPVLFLCSEGASYMSGAIIDVNGGQL